LLKIQNWTKCIQNREGRGRTVEKVEIFKEWSCSTLRRGRVESVRPQYLSHSSCVPCSRSPGLSRKLTACCSRSFIFRELYIVRPSETSANHLACSSTCRKHGFALTTSDAASCSCGLTPTRGVVPSRDWVEAMLNWPGANLADIRINMCAAVVKLWCVWHCGSERQ
jgi:hypothetical protein